MASDRQGDGVWKTRRIRTRHLYEMRDGSGRFVHEQDFVVAKRRWADRALGEIQGKPDQAGHPRYFLRYDVPGTNLTLFLPDPRVQGVIDFTSDFIQKARRELKELDAILSVPMEEADGTTILDRGEAKGGRS